MRRIPLIASAAAVLCALVGVVGMVERAEATTAAKKCPRGQVAVTVAGKRSCRPAAGVLPRPRAIDGRLPTLRLALQRSPFAEAGAAGQEAQRRMLAALPQVLKAVDELAVRPARAPAGVRGAAGCGLEAPESGSRSVGGVGVSISANGATMSFQLDGQTFLLRFASCPKTFSLPRCPSASGEIRSTSSRSLAMTQEVWQGNIGDALVKRMSITSNERTSVEGKVADDARLDHIDIDDASELFFVATGGLVFRGTITRRVRVDMRTGKYDPARSNLVLQGDSVKISKDDDDRFAATVDQAIKTFRSAEKEWTSFDPGKDGFCATAVFTPRSDTLKLKSGQNGRISVYARASSGGKATGARWTLLDQTNARFTPTTSRGPAPQISYQVSKTPAGARVRVTVKFTSTAGVGKDTWTQPIGDSLPKRISGTFSGRSGNSEVGFTWSGTITFVRDRGRSTALGDAHYYVDSASFTSTYVVNQAGCSGTSTGSATLGKQNPALAQLVLDLEPTRGKGWRYEIRAPLQGPLATIVIKCPSGVDLSQPWPLTAYLGTQPSAFYSDTKTFKGTNTVGSVSATWSLRGSD